MGSEVLRLPERRELLQRSRCAAELKVSIFHNLFPFLVLGFNDFRHKRSLLAVS